MTRKSRTRTLRKRVRIEKHELKVIRFGTKTTKAYCQRCRGFVVAVTIDNAVAITQLSVTDLVRRIEADQLHLVGTTSERPLICGKSLGTSDFVTAPAGTKE